MTTAGLTVGDSETLKQILSDFAGQIDEVSVFGSRATGTARANSDIDLVIYGCLADTDVDRLWTLFDDSSISVSVDVIAYEHTLYPPLRRHVDRTHKVLFTGEELRQMAADEEARDALSRTL